MYQKPAKLTMAHAANTTLSNMPTASADSAMEDLAADVDEPPDRKGQEFFTKTQCSAQRNPSLLSKMIHTSESDSHVDEDDYAFYEPHRATSSASTYSRGSAVSVADFASDITNTSPHTTSPTDELPVFKQNVFQVIPPQKLHDDFKHTTEPAAATAPKVAETLVKKRCITFACGSKAPKPKTETATEIKKIEVQPTAEQKRKCSLTFICPTRNNATQSKPHVRLSSPPPPIRASNNHPRQHRDSDATLRTSSPKLDRKISSTTHHRRGSTASNASRASAIRFHEFASSDEEVDDWVKESTCYQSRLTIDDTLAKENNLRKLGKEAEEEEEEDDIDEDEEEDDEAVEDDDDDDDDNEDEDGDSAQDDTEIEDGVLARLRSKVISEDIDEGFQTDDEHGFAHSDDDEDANSDYDWWAPGRSAGTHQVELSRPKAMPRRASDSSIESNSSSHRGIPISPQLQRKRCRALHSARVPAPELPDSTDFVCGTLDEDRPLEQAFLNHLQQRRAAKHKTTPQDIDPTFPASDPEIEDEEDEDSDHVATESDAHILMHGEMDGEDERSRRSNIQKRSPAPSPRRLRSPAPTKRAVTRRSPPPPATRRARSPAPCAIFNHSRLSSSVPRRGSLSQMRERFDEPIAEEDDNTPRFNRQAVDIVMGLERKRARRREKLYEKHCRKAAKTKEKKEIKRGKGAEKMRDLGIGLNEYRGRKNITPNQQADVGEVHMLSY